MDCFIGISWRLGDEADWRLFADGYGKSCNRKSLHLLDVGQSSQSLDRQC